MRSALLFGTDPPAAAREQLQCHGITLTVLQPGTNVGALMRRAGNGSGGLPFTVALRADTREARVCAGQSGELDAKDLQRIASACVSRPCP